MVANRQPPLKPSSGRETGNPRGVGGRGPASRGASAGAEPGGEFLELPLVAGVRRVEVLAL